jgi:hypothetical protein
VIDFYADTARIRANVTAMHLWKLERRDPHALEPTSSLEACSMPPPSGPRTLVPSGKSFEIALPGGDPPRSVVQGFAHGEDSGRLRRRGARGGEDRSL